ncbi:U-box domain-containing protein [Actinidia chinensis var. chinensis]|uniref:U-box domain-containing protein n=1 Tax=Actinidia chinensis var. chinensis TaxID=1590841 RepID=A0A2R6QZB3_ACTCC|nr:U-box domain-containing protein [Actinidia chinensis var. chinensis]
MMAKCLRNDIGTGVLERHGGGNSRLWTAFSGASFRRTIIDSMRCGGSRDRHDGFAAAKPLPEKLKQKNEKQKQRSDCGSASKKKNVNGSEKLSDISRLSEWPENGFDGVAEEEVRRKVEALEELKRVAKCLQSDYDLLGGAIEVRRLTKENSEARTTLALLGAIPPLVSLLDSEDLASQIGSLYALLNLGIGNAANKAAIVKAGAVHKMLRLVESPNGSPNPAVAEAVVANFLGLSALDSNKPIIGSSGAIPFLVKTLKDLDQTRSSQAKQDTLRALYNLSISPLNVPQIIETNLVPFLLSTLGNMEVSERILSILSNVVSTGEGRKGVSIVPDAFQILVDALNWTDSPGCQEKASYILMVMVHKSYGDRQVMIEAGIASSLLELTLLGSTLAQKRASRILERLRVDKGKQVLENFGGGIGTAVSAPIYGGSSSTSIYPNLQLKECLEEEEGVMSEERKAVKQLVQHSLQNNMRRIAKRANIPQDFIPSDHLKSLTSNSTSKSLPF